jgi:hypothetical protein
MARWEPGAVWEHGTFVVRRLRLRGLGPHGLAWFNVQGAWSTVGTVKVSDMTEANGWRFIAPPEAFTEEGNER